MADSAEKISTYRQMLELDPASRVFELLAEELCAAGKWEEVADVCRQGLKYHPEHMRPRVLLTLALVEMGEMVEAEPVLFEIHDEIRKNSIIFRLLSEVAASSGDSLRAAEFLRIYDAFRKSEEPGAGAEEPGVEELTPETGPEAEYEPSALPQSPTEEPLQAQTNPAERLGKILSGLAQRIESRTPTAPTPSAIFSDADRDLLRNTILAEVGF